MTIIERMLRHMSERGMPDQITMTRAQFREYEDATARDGATAILPRPEHRETNPNAVGTFCGVPIMIWEPPPEAAHVIDSPLFAYGA